MPPETEEVVKADDPLDPLDYIFPGDDVPCVKNDKGEDVLDWDALRRNADEAAHKKNWHAGVPLPLPGLDLVCTGEWETFGKYLNLILNNVDDDGKPITLTEHEEQEKAKIADPNVPEDEKPVWNVVNKWYSRKHQGDVVIYQHPNGKRTHRIEYGDVTSSKISMWWDTYSASSVYSIEAELKAMEKLQGMIPKLEYAAYMTTGVFTETSKRSGLTYMFRKCRPTMVFRHQEDKTMEFIAALCMHPVGYYQGTWAGCLVPTDDVIAHLLMMRGDEYNFWKKSVHHDIDDPRTGL